MLPQGEGTPSSKQPRGTKAIRILWTPHLTPRASPALPCPHHLQLFESIEYNTALWLLFTLLIITWPPTPRCPGHSMSMATHLTRGPSQAAGASKSCTKLPF